MVAICVARVTGGTRGIGAAVAVALANEGASVAVGYWHNQEMAEKFGVGMQAEHPRQRFTTHEGNIGVAGDCRRVVREVIDQHGRLDILVNNAGITIDKVAAKMDDDDWHKVLDIKPRTLPTSGPGYRMAFAVHRFGDRMMDTFDARPGLVRGSAGPGAPPFP